MTFGDPLYSLGLIQSDATLVDADDVITKATLFEQTIALSGNQQDIAAGSKKGFWPVEIDIRVVGMVLNCDPSNEPSSGNIEVDANRVDRTDGTPTSILSSVASIATGANRGTGTVDGTQDFDAGDMMTFDVDQGSDGYDLLVTILYVRR